jgi:hypothetical protein
LPGDSFAFVFVGRLSGVTSHFVSRLAAAALACQLTFNPDSDALSSTLKLDLQNAPSRFVFEGIFEA